MQLVSSSSVTSKKSPNVYESCAKWCHSKNERFWQVYKKIPNMWAKFWQNNCCHKFWKVAQSAINRQICSHCSSLKSFPFWCNRTIRRMSTQYSVLGIEPTTFGTRSGRPPKYQILIWTLLLLNHRNSLKTVHIVRLSLEISKYHEKGLVLVSRGRYIIDVYICALIDHHNWHSAT